MISDILITIGIGIIILILLLFFAVCLLSFLEDDTIIPKFIRVIGCIEMIILMISFVLVFAYVVGSCFLGGI